MRRLGLFVLSLVVLPVFLAPPASAAEIVITTDATGAMFAAGQLSPGYQATRCIEVSWRENDRPRLVGISADVTGTLAPYLQIKVEAGDGGRYASCAGFVGKEIYGGTLDVLGSWHPNPDAQLLARRVTSAAGSISFRVTVSILDVNAAQARTASASFVFAALQEAGWVPPPATTPPPNTASPGPSPPQPTPTRPAPRPTTSQPTLEPSTPTADPTPAPVETEVTTEPTPSTATPEPAVAMPSPGGNPPDPGSESKYGAGPSVTVPLTPLPEEKATAAKSPIRTFLDVMGGAGEIVEQAAAPVAKGLAWAVWSLPVLLLFVALQNNIDARDPKLSQAPAYAERSLPFDDGYEMRPDPGGGDV